MKQNMQIVSEKFVFHVLYKLSHSWIILPIEMESNTATKKCFKSFIWWVGKAPPCGRRVEDLRQQTTFSEYFDWKSASGVSMFTLQLTSVVLNYNIMLW